MTTTQRTLTAAAKRDLAKLRAGEHVDLRYGPYAQLLEAGYIEGTQDNYRLVSCRANHDTARQWCDVCPECGAALDA